MGRAAGLALVLLSTLGFAPRPKGQYDLIVYGATPQGVTAACAAARHGLHVLVLEPGQHVGGVLTAGWLATLDSSNDASGRLLYGGLFAEFLRRLGYDPSFDVRTAERVLRDMLQRGDVTVLFGRQLTGVRTQGGHVTRLVTRTSGQRQVWAAGTFIDTTDTAELASRAGASFSLGREDTGLDRRQMAATLVFRLVGVNWQALGAALAREESDERQPVGWHGRTAFGFASLGARYQPSDPRRFGLRGLNVARQDDGSLLVNALQVFGVNGTSPASVRQAYREAALEAGRVAAYLRRAAPEVFGQAYLSGVAPELYLRESRHLQGRYRLQVSDVLFGQAFTDGVARGGYPLDGQRYLGSDRMFLLGTPRPYEVPLRSLLSPRLSNLLVVSQAASFDSSAAFSARVVPLQMALGEAAGEAVWQAGEQERTLAALAADPGAMSELRRRLRLPPQNAQPGSEARLPGYAPAVELLQRGLFNAPYTLRGGLGLALPIHRKDFLINLGHLYAVHQPSPTFWPAWRQLWSAEAGRVSEPLTEAEAGEMLVRLGLPAFEPEVPYDTFTRGRAASVLYRLWLRQPGQGPGAESASSAPPPEATAQQTEQ